MGQFLFRKWVDDFRIFKGDKTEKTQFVECKPTGEFEETRNSIQSCTPKVKYSLNIPKNEIDIFCSLQIDPP